MWPERSRPLQGPVSPGDRGIPSANSIRLVLAHFLHENTDLRATTAGEAQRARVKPPYRALLEATEQEVVTAVATAIRPTTRILHRLGTGDRTTDDSQSAPPSHYRPSIRRSD